MIILILHVLHFKGANDTNILRARTRLRKGAFKGFATVVDVWNVSLLLMARVVVLRRHEIQYVMVSAITDINGKSLNAYHCLMLFGEGSRVGDKKSCVCLTVLRVIMVRIYTQGLHAIERRDFQRGTRVFIPIIARMVRVPDRFLTFIVPSLVNVGVRVRTIKANVLIAIKMRREVRCNNENVMGFHP